MARAEQDLKRLTYMLDSYDIEPNSNPELDNPEIKEPQQELLCPNCGSDKIKIIQLIGKNFTVCIDCKWRRLKQD